ncbi:MAG: anaerobic ribonucleoside-triphosphate reductase activating protein [Bacilli bacterium]
MKYLKILNETISDGVGLRLSIYLSGCSHHCPYCHNESSWNENNGYDLDDGVIENIVTTYQNNPMLSGITFTGGDPLFNFKEFTYLIKKIKLALNCNIWVYTGYTYEQIKNEEFIYYIDVLVDGKFEIKSRCLSLYFRGSKNQRIIDVKSSLIKSSIKIINFE